MSAKLLGAAFEATMPSHAAKLVLLKLVDEARDDGSRCYPSVGRIAAAAQTSRRHVQRLLRKFVEVGLISVEVEGGAGRGDTTEYRLHLDMLSAIGKVGWSIATGISEPESDAEVESPKEDGGNPGEPPEKSVTMSPLAERATSEAAKGDIGDTKGRHQESPNPLRDPLSTPEERGAREERDDKRRPFRDLAAQYPDAAADDLSKAERLYDRLSEPSYRAMWDGLPAFCVWLKAQRRRPPLQDFLRDGLWEFVDAAGTPKPASDGKIEVKRYSRGMWALIWRCDKADKSPIDVLNLLAGGSWRFDAKVAPTEAEEARLVQIAAKSPEFDAWRAYANARWPELRLRFPVPDVAEFVWTPSAWPPGQQARDTAA